jgi:hypothetical protein
VAVLPPWVTPITDEVQGPILPPWEMAPPVNDAAPPPVDQQGVPMGQTLAPPGMAEPPPPGPDLVDASPGVVLPPWEQQPSHRPDMAPQADMQAQAAPPPPVDNGEPDAVSGGAMANQAPVQPPWGKQGPMLDPEAGAIAQKYAIQSRAEEEAAQSAQAAADTYAQTIKDNAAKQQREQELAAGAEAKVGEAWQAVADAKVDPEHWMKSRSTGQTIATYIGAAIGGFLGVRNGTGRNTFLEGIKDAIHDDIAAQETNIGNLKSAAAGKESVYGQMLQRFGNADVARNMTAATLYQAAGQQMQAKLAGYKSTETQQDGIIAMTELQKQRDASLGAAKKAMFDHDMALDEQARKDAESRANIGKTYAETRKLNAEAAGVGKPNEEKEALKVVPNLLIPQMDERGRPIFQYQEVQAPDGSPLKPTPILQGRGPNKGQPMLDPKTGKPLYQEVEADKTGATSVESVKVGQDKDGKPIYEDRVVKREQKMVPHKARDEKESGEIAEAIEGYREYEDALNQISELGKTYGKEWFKSSEGSQMYALARQNAIFATQKIHGVKRMTDTDLKLFERTLPDPGHLTTIGDTEKALQFAREYGKKTVRARLDKYGVPMEAAINEPQVQSSETPIDLSRGENWQHPSTEQRVQSAREKQVDIQNSEAAARPAQDAAYYDKAQQEWEAAQRRQRAE